MAFRVLPGSAERAFSDSVFVPAPAPQGSLKCWSTRFSCAENLNSPDHYSSARQHSHTRNGTENRIAFQPCLSSSRISNRYTFEHGHVPRTSDGLPSPARLPLFSSHISRVTTKVSSDISWFLGPTRAIRPGKRQKICVETSVVNTRSAQDLFEASSPNDREPVLRKFGGLSYCQRPTDVRVTAMCCLEAS